MYFVFVNLGKFRTLLLFRGLQNRFQRFHKKEEKERDTLHTRYYVPILGLVEWLSLQ